MELWGLQNHRKGDFLINQIYLFIRIHANEPNLIARQLYVLRLHIEIKSAKTCIKGYNCLTKRLDKVPVAKMFGLLHTAAHSFAAYQLRCNIS